MEEGKKVREKTIEKLFKEKGKTWKVVNFKRESRPIPTATYELSVSGFR